MTEAVTPAPDPLMAAAMPVRLFWPGPMVTDTGEAVPTWIVRVPVPNTVAVGSVALPVLTDSWAWARAGSWRRVCQAVSADVSWPIWAWYWARMLVWGASSAWMMAWVLRPLATPEKDTGAPAEPSGATASDTRDPPPPAGRGAGRTRHPGLLGRSLAGDDPQQQLRLRVGLDEHAHAGLEEHLGARETHHLLGDVGVGDDTVRDLQVLARDLQRADGGLQPVLDGADDGPLARDLGHGRIELRDGVLGRGLVGDDGPAVEGGHLADGRARLDGEAGAAGPEHQVHLGCGRGVVEGDHPVGGRGGVGGRGDGGPGQALDQKGHGDRGRAERGDAAGAGGAWERRRGDHLEVLLAGDREVVEGDGDACPGSGHRRCALGDGHPGAVDQVGVAVGREHDGVAPAGEGAPRGDRGGTHRGARHGHGGRAEDRKST